SFSVISFNEATLALRLRELFGMSASQAGAMYFFAGGVYAFTSLLSGYLTKKMSEPRILVMTGTLVTLVGLIIQGPLVRMEQPLWLIYISQMLIGLGNGPVYVCSYLHSLR